MGQLLNVCTTNALSRVMLGRKVFNDGSKSDPKANEFKSMVEEMMVLAGTFNIGDFIPPLGCLDLQGIVGKMKKLHARFDAFLNTILEEHKLNDQYKTSQDVDFLSTLIRLKGNADMDGEEGKLTDVEIKALLLVGIQFPKPFHFYIL